jgi:hypothetical protein
MPGKPKTGTPANWPKGWPTLPPIKRPTPKTIPVPKTPKKPK